MRGVCSGCAQGALEGGSLSVSRVFMPLLSLCGCSVALEQPGSDFVSGWITGGASGGDSE